MTLEPLVAGAGQGRAGAPVRRAAVAVALAGAVAALSACGSVSEHLAERASEAPGIGLPANAPDRPATPVVFPAVHDMPPARPAALLNEAEQQRLEKELLAARARNQASAGLPITPPPPEKKPEASARPPAPSKPIY
jgi:hypothetical protein